MRKSELPAGEHSIWARTREGIAWRVARILRQRTINRLLPPIARAWRPLLGGSVFIGVAGTAGKSTTKEFCREILAQRGSVSANPGTRNNIGDIAKAILETRRRDAFCVVELSEHLPGVIDAPLALLRPSIGALTVVGMEHWRAFNSLDAIAAEISKLVAALPPDGTIVLNADDPLIATMAANFSGRKIFYGESAESGLRASNVTSSFPERLSMTVMFEHEEAQVRTQLCGTHWTPSVLAAIGIGLAAGLTLQECARALTDTPPLEGRMQPVESPDGVTFIRDDFKAPLWGMHACFKVMREAKAQRKIVVVGTISDTGAGSDGKHLQKLARDWLEIADLLIFVGPTATSVLKIRSTANAERLHAFGRVKEVADFLRSSYRSGDLILLKGNVKQDHLQRIALDAGGQVGCWADRCGRGGFCTLCQHLHTPRDDRPSTPIKVTGAQERELPHLDQHEQVIIGLGNPDPKYACSPHNIGYDTVDLLAAQCGLSWTEYNDAWIARGVIKDHPVCLIKARVAMNLTGAVIVALSESMGFTAERCLLVFDDLATSLDRVRMRLHGGAGGHRGVASILLAFQTDAIPRVKIGIAVEDAAEDYLVTPLMAAERERAETAMTLAAQRVTEFIAKCPATACAEIAN